jgi:hypothetical protein
MDYQARLYEYYISTHLAFISDISIEAFERQRSAFNGYFGHFLPKDRGAKIWVSKRVLRRPCGVFAKASRGI